MLCGVLINLVEGGWSTWERGFGVPERGVKYRYADRWLEVRQAETELRCAWDGFVTWELGLGLGLGLELGLGGEGGWEGGGGG